MTPPPARPEGSALSSDVDGSGVFDVREFARTARGSHRGDPAVVALDGAALPADAITLIRVLRDLERTTLDRMRNLLVTATHKDARVTAFLTTWAFEKFWIADALDAVLEAVGAEARSDTGSTRPRRRFAERAERRGPVARAIAANFQGPQIVAAHVTTGLVDEWIAQAAYRRLAALAAPLGPLSRLVLEIKDRHIHFLSEEAHRRLADSDRARRVTQKLVRQSAWPLGAVTQPASDRAFFERTVFGDETGRRAAAAITASLAELPGMTAVAPTIAARLVA